MTPKKVCVIGFGEMGRRHAKDLEEFTDGSIRIAGVVEPSDQSYGRGCEWLGKAPPRYDSIEAMLSEAHPEGIVIATPNSRHLDSLLPLRGRRIPLLLEKPLDTDLEKVRRIVAFADEYAAPIMVHHVMRYAPIVLKAKELVDSGAIGRIAGFHMSQFIHGGMFHNFRRTFRTGGGQLLEKATHDFDLLLFLTGSAPRRVSALCKRHYYGGDMPDDLRCPQCEKKDACSQSVTRHMDRKAVPGKDLCVFAREIDIFDNESCLIEMENGATGVYSQCFFSHAPFSRRYEFNGTRGFLAMDFSAGDLLLRNRDGEETFHFDYHRRIHYNGAPGVAAHFLELLTGATDKVHSPVREAFAAELISFAAYQASARGAFVDLAPLLDANVAGKPLMRREEECFGATGREAPLALH